MKHQLLARAGTGIAICVAAGSALAHDGHGMVGAHWHASDTLGFLLVALLAAGAVWISGRGK